MTPAEAREVRSLALRILELVPDPDRPVHASGGAIVPRATLCGRGGRRPVVGSHPERVTCRACLSSSEWEAWRFRMTDDAPG